jgi:hypothetical protein
MSTAHEKAGTAPTAPALEITARQGGNVATPHEDRTMVTPTMAPPDGATRRLLFEEDRSRTLNPGEPIKFNVSMDGQPVVTRSTVPLYDSCRVLAAFGFTGKVEFVRPDGTVSMLMDIEAGAKLTVVEDAKRGPRVVKYTPADGDEAGLDGRKLALRNRTTDDELSLLDGRA